MGAKIIKVNKNSPAHIYGIKKWDEIIKINGNPIFDCLDYRFYSTEENLEIELKRDENIITLNIKKEQYDDIGVDFDDYLMDTQKSCHNACIFCFIDQNPKGMRETIYFKDDDTRLSFLQGNYVTLTNVKYRDIDRIISQKISPINVSVQTTNPELRVKMLKNKKSSNIMDLLKKLTENGITINCQIVLCKGINDGSELEHSLEDLCQNLKNIGSISVVPVGISDHREGLFHLIPFDKESTLQTIEIVNKVGDKNLAEKGSRLVYLADEFYLKAEVEIPNSAYYEDFPQIENGVGLMASLYDEFKDGLLLLEDIDLESQSETTIVTGVAAYEFICNLVEKLKKKCKKIKVNIIKVENRFFGKNITVSGLVVGSDIIAKLKNEKHYNNVLIPSTMLRAEDDIFLDDVSIIDIENELNVEVTPTLNDGYELISKILRSEE